VYFLNSKNEDSSAVLAKESNEYEDEIQTILGDARRRITTYTTALESSVTKQQHEAALAHLAEQHAEIRDKAAAASRQQLEQRSVDTVRRFREQYDGRVAELNRMKDAFVARTRELEEAKQPVPPIPPCRCHTREAFARMAHKRKCTRL
jgi:glycine betaine/choline ABC-type transport system substrate-binding protein